MKLIQFVVFCGAIFSNLVQANTPPIDIINVVWGREYTDLFLNFAIPLQVCPRNLGCIDPHSTRYRIFTPKEDWDYMQAHSSIKKLQEMVPVEFVEILPPVPGSCRYQKMKECHDQAIVDAGQKGAALIFLAPDLLVPNQLFETILKKAKEGYRAVLSNGFPIRKDALLSMSKILLHDETIQKNGISPRDLTTFGLRHFHPMYEQLFVNGIDCCPSGIFWKLDDHNLLAHSWWIGPIYIWPENYSPFRIDEYFIIHACPDPDRWAQIQDSDEMIALNCGTSHNPEDKFFKVPYDPRAVAEWARPINPGNMFIFEKPIYFHSTDYREEWKEMEEEAREFVQKVLSLMRY